MEKRGDVWVRVETLGNLGKRVGPFRRPQRKQLELVVVNESVRIRAETRRDLLRLVEIQKKKGLKLVETRVSAW